MPDFEVISPFKPSGDQPGAITALADGVRRGDRYQTLQGITGSGKTATIAWMIEQVQRPTLIIEPNKSLAAQLSSELRDLFPKNRVEFFVSYYDYYQPEAYLPSTDTYIEKDSSINDEIDRLRHATTSSLLMRRDVIVVASVSCIYGLGSPEEYRDRILGVAVGEQMDQRDMLRRLVDLQYARNDVNLVRGTFRARGDTVEIHPAYEEQALRVELFGDTIERIVPFDVLTGEMGDEMEDMAVYAATHYVTGDEIVQRAVGTIEVELRERLQEFEKEGKLLEAQRLRVRTEHDLEMLAETGVCSGVENYSRHLDGRAPGRPPTRCSTSSPRTTCASSTRATSPSRSCTGSTPATARARTCWSSTASACPRPGTTGRSASRSSSSACPRPSSCRRRPARSRASTRPRWWSRSSAPPASSTPR